ncbi:hypothetical protein BH09VER1_BH09VER1_07650 [soil metagenome]
MVQFARHNRIEFRVGARMGNRIFSTFDLIFVHRGKLSMEAAKSTLLLRKRQAILIYPKTAFGGVCVEAAEVSSQHFALEPDEESHSAILARLVGRANGFELAQKVFPAWKEQEIDRSIRLASLEQTPVVQEMRIAQLVLSLAEWEMQAAVVCGGSAHTTEIASLVKWMEINLHRRITLEDMAAEVGISVSQFREIFKEQIGTSPANFFQNMRMDTAKRMLLESNEAIKSIAQAVGFEDLSHFYRSFGRHTGKTPAEFRRRHIKKA